MTRLKQFWMNYAHRYRWIYLLGIVCLVVTNLLTVAIPRFVQHAIDILERGGAASETTQWVAAILLAGVGVIIVRTLSRTLFFNPGRTVEFRVKNALFNHLLELPQHFYDAMRPGEIISRGTNDINSIRALIGYGTLQIFNVGLILILTLFEMFSTHVTLTLMCIAPLVVASIVLRIAIAKMFTIVKESQAQIAILSDRILESYSGAGVIRAFNAEHGAQARFDEANERLLELGVRLARIVSWLLPIVGVVGNVSLVILLVWGGDMIAKGELTLGQLTAFAVYINIVVAGLQSLGWLVNAAQRGWISLGRVNEILDAPLDRAPAKSTLPESTDGGLALEVRDLSFRFPDAAEQALRDVSFQLKAGQTLGIFGLTGSGKTTLLNLLARVYDPEPGTVFIGGSDATEVPVDTYWKRVAYVPQEPFLFSRSVQGNIALATSDEDDANPSVRAAVEAAAADASLTSDLEILPEGLDTRVGERGVTLSGGQKQRTALARAFYRDFDVLLLDDVLSAVDHETEKALIEAIYRRGQGATMLLVSHRISVLSKADHIIVFEEGRVRDRGDHESLATQADGPYARAWRLQQAEGTDG